MTIRFMRIAFLITKAAKRTVRICNTYCFYCNSGYMNTPQCYVMRTLYVLLLSMSAVSLTGR